MQVKPISFLIDDVRPATMNYIQVRKVLSFIDPQKMNQMCYWVRILQGQFKFGLKVPEEPTEWTKTTSGGDIHLANFVYRTDYCSFVTEAATVRRCLNCGHVQDEAAFRSNQRGENEAIRCSNCKVELKEAVSSAILRERGVQDAMDLDQEEREGKYSWTAQTEQIGTQEGARFTRDCTSQFISLFKEQGKRGIINLSTERMWLAPTIDRTGADKKFIEEELPAFISKVNAEAKQGKFTFDTGMSRELLTKNRDKQILISRTGTPISTADVTTPEGEGSGAD